MWVAVREVQCFPCLLSPPPPRPPPTSGSGLSQRGGHTNQRLLFQRLNIQHRPCPCLAVLCSNLSIGLQIFVIFFAFLAPRVQCPILGRKLEDWYLPNPTIIVTPAPHYQPSLQHLNIQPPSNKLAQLFFSIIPEPHIDVLYLHLGFLMLSLPSTSINTTQRAG